jgi:hypothetical protein
MHGIAGQALAAVDSGVAEHPLEVGVVGHIRHVADDSSALKGIDCKNVSIKPKLLYEMKKKIKFEMHKIMHLRWPTCTRSILTRSVVLGILSTASRSAQRLAQLDVDAS